MQEARLGPNHFGDMGQKGDDIVFDHALNLVNAVGIPDHIAPLFPDRLGRVLGDHAKLGHGIGGMGLDLEPDAVLGLGRPKVGAFRAGITRDHDQGSVGGCGQRGWCLDANGMAPMSRLWVASLASIA